MQLTLCPPPSPGVTTMEGPVKDEMLAGVCLMRAYSYSSYCTLQSLKQSAGQRPRSYIGPIGKASTSRPADLGFTPAFAGDPFPGRTKQVR